MSLSAEIDTARLSVLLDVRHPFAYLAFQPTAALAESLGLEINWLPLGVPALNAPKPALETDDRGTRHRRSRARAIAREIETYAAARGLALRDYYRVETADAAELGWLWVRDRHPEQLQRYLAELFGAYWSQGLDASDIDQVEALVDGSGADGAAFLTWSLEEGPPASAALAAELRSRGLFQVPAYVVDGDVFYGRQHLPMIQWILEGRSGAIPI